MGIYEKNILPRLINWVCSSSEFSKLRGPLLKEVRGQVLEIGFGSGTNLPFYTKNIKKLFALDPEKLGQVLASEKLKLSKFPVEFIDFKDDGSYPLENESMDYVVSSWTLCTIPDVKSALKEIKRILKKDGKFVFVEHGLSPDEKVARWQHRLNPIQKAIGGGCHLNRKINEIIMQSGFDIKNLENFYINGPKIVTYHYKGVAMKQET